MRKFIKYAAVGLAGYFIGFYELKYRMMKLITVSKTNEVEELKNSKGGGGSE